MSSKQKEKLMKRKWKSLIARGITPPKDDAERKQRLKKAHDN